MSLGGEDLGVAQDRRRPFEAATMPVPARVLLEDSLVPTTLGCSTTRATLAGVFQREVFEDLDTSCNGLTPLPVVQRAGSILVGTVPGIAFDVDAFLCRHTSMPDEHSLGACQYVGRVALRGSNWKLAYDGYLDFYHLPILHKRTFGADYNNHQVSQLGRPPGWRRHASGRLRPLRSSQGIPPPRTVNIMR